MQNLPHQYRVEASATRDGPVVVASGGFETLSTAPPAEYHSPGDQWSPETLFVAAVVDCFVLTFRAIARASSLAWVNLQYDGEGEFDRVEHTTQFTGMTIRAYLAIPPAVNAEKAARLLDKAERTCLIASSLACPVKLERHVATESVSERL